MVHKLFDAVSGSCADRKHFHAESIAVCADAVQRVRSLLKQVTFVCSDDLLLISDLGLICREFLVDRLYVLYRIPSF